jgi:DNA-binding MarR family transcriptional regulator
LDLGVAAIDLISVVVLIFALFVGGRSFRAFKQSRQAVSESASLLQVIVGALTSRIQHSESVLNELRSRFEIVEKRSGELGSSQADLRSAYLQVLKHLQEILSNDKRLIGELEQMKTMFAAHEQMPPTERSQMRVERPLTPVIEGDILASLTGTELQTLEILLREGPKAAPELGRRLRKSREHTSRLMKKLYLEGYVERESNRAPFRYKINETVRSTMQSQSKQVTVKASEKT